MNRWFVLTTTACIMFLLPTSFADQKPPFPASLYADCYLGDGDYRVQLYRVSATMTHIVFKPYDAKRPRVTLNVEGVLEGFENMGPDLILSFVNPGPTTRVYSEVDGRVQQTLECTSRLGAIPLPIYAVHAIGCLRGEKMVGNLWVPVTVQIFLRHRKGYELAAEVPFEDLYSKLDEIEKEVLPKVAADPRKALDE
jgi:hypothetical protein